MASSSDVNDNNTSIEEVEEILEKRMRGLRVIEIIPLNVPLQNAFKLNLFKGRIFG